MADVKGKYERVRWDRLYAKHCPNRTDGTSRYAKIVSENLLSKQNGAGKILRDAGYEVDDWAGAIAHTVKMLWEARAEIERLGGNPFPHISNAERAKHSAALRALAATKEAPDA